MEHSTAEMGSDLCGVKMGLSECMLHLHFLGPEVGGKYFARVGRKYLQGAAAACTGGGKGPP